MFLNYLELRRKGEEIFYFKGKREVDFLIRKGADIDRLINVCWDLNQDNEERELSGLAEAMEKFKVPEAEIVVAGYDDQAIVKGKKIRIRNFFNWLKNENQQA